MTTSEDGYLLRIFIGESDRDGYHPLYESIVLKARQQGLAGATVLRGAMGFGKNSILHTAKILRLSEDLPMVIEIVDTLDKIEKFLPHLEELISDGLVTLDKVKVIYYQGEEQPAPGASDRVNIQLSASSHPSLYTGLPIVAPSEESEMQNMHKSLVGPMMILFIVVLFVPTSSLGQTAGPLSSPITTFEERPDHDKGEKSLAERAGGSEAERIAALEEALKAQSAMLEQLRNSMAEQSRLIGELSALANGTDQTVSPPLPNAANTAIAAGLKSTAQSSQQQVGISERLGVVEAQAKKTSESLSRQLGSMTFSGDIRLRFESFFGLSNSLANAANPTVLGNELTPRFRPRIRARLAVRGQITDEFDWGLRFATGGFADNISTNQTLTDFFNRKPFALDQAFISYKPKAVRGLRLQGGRFEPPWTYTEMTIDNDLMVEGFSESYSRDFKGKLKNLTVAAWQLPFLERNSAFVRNADGTVNVEQSRRGGRDLALYGAHLRTRIEPNSKIALALSISDLFFSGTQFITPVQVFGSQIQLPLTITIPATATTPAQTITTQVSIPRDLLVAGNGNLGLTNASTNATNRDGRLSSGYNLVDFIARLDLKHSKRFPVSLLLNFVTNTQTHDVVTAGPGGANLIIPNRENNGFWAEVQVGKTRERGDIQLGYTFLRIEKDAVLTPFNFSDITQQSDMRGHRFNFAYAADPRVILSLTGVITERPTGLLGVFGTTPLGSLNRPTTRLQFDTSFRF